MTTQELTLKQNGEPENLEKIVEWRTCKKDSLYFLKRHLKIKDETLGIIAWEDWDYLVELLDLLTNNKQVIILKARQLGISTLLAGYCLWRALFYEGSTIYLLSQGEKEAGNLLYKCKVGWEFLPDFLRPRLGKDQESALSFPSMHSSIDALPSTEKAGRSTGATIVVCDEWERHPYARENFAAIKPTVDTTGGQFIGLSTTDALKSDTLFKELYRKAQLGEGNFIRKFVPWNARPGRDEHWFNAKIKPDYPEWQIRAEYPLTEEEALATIEVVSFFELEPLKEMLADCTLKPELRHNGLVKIYKPARMGGHYFSGIDISDGRYDYTAMPVMDWQTGEVVATFHAMMPADEATYIIDELGREYNNALLAPERNQPGLAVINKLKDLDYPNIHYMGEGKPGWWTSGGAQPTSRGAILHELRLPLTRREIIIYDPEVIKELMSFIQKKDDVPQAQPGAHDDWVLAMAITWQMRKYIKTGHTKFRSFVRKGAF